MPPVSLEKMNALFLIQNIAPYHSARINHFAAEYEYGTYVLTSNSSEEFAILGEYESDPVFVNLRLDDFSYVAFRKLVIENCINYIFCSGYSFYASILAIRLAAELHNVYIFACWESNYFDKKRFFLSERFKSLLVSCYSGFLVGSESHGDYVRRLYTSTQPLRIMLGYDVVDNYHFSPKKSNESRRKDNPGVRFIAVSRFEKKKNLLRLIHAFSLALSCYHKTTQYKETKIGMQLILVGAGTLEPKINRLIAKLDLGDHVCLTGPVAYSSLPELYGCCDVLIHPSTTEQWGLVINEAMSAGLAVLCSTQTGASKVLVDADNGYTFDAYSINSIAAAITGIMTMPKAQIESFGVNSLTKVNLLAPLSSFSHGALALIKSDPIHKPKHSLLNRLVISILCLLLK